ncbi:2-polyprenyl-3-methyl-5-hydroxy-6-metoxy-1,4-benzoquinol methylase [Luteibacter sp. 1214]|uniref:class I SAM-dependent methyltransferase n=1 Tax=Luteibacter sp. 1214 TaxID=2817735 RepID=UPI0028573804|nr:methyltransferase domain-containing protein [Luteibacter sp. 1214]MDR6642667.1 2-polyprenyl-3-methyl-5-hydroxy-6-metoxy-1,4-benzoquinol methylase [Luteibacter sp. 1214]
MKGFHDALDELIAVAKPSSIYEVGCGEGYWVARWHAEGYAAAGCDVSGEVIALARANTAHIEMPSSTFDVCDIYDVARTPSASELVVCCEVLEHIEDPLRGLRALRAIAGDYVILSVPREPLWRALNMVRGKYLVDGGNTPGHIQHWSARSFRRLVEEVFDVVEVKSPIPWTMLLCRRRD